MSQPTSIEARLSPRVLIAFACVYFFWGSTFVAIRFGVAVLPPFVLASTRFLVAGPLMLAICAARGLQIRQTRRSMLILILLGVLMLGVGNVGLTWSEQYLPAGLAALLVAVIPLYVAMAEAFLPGGERLRARGWVGIAIGFAGLVALLSPGIREGFQAGTGHSRQLFAAIVTLVCALGWIAGSIVSRRAKLPTAPFVAAAWEMLFGGLFNAGLSIGAGSWHHARFSMHGLWAVSWLIVFGSLVGYSAYIYLLEHVPVAKVSTYAYINPIVAVILGALFLGERLVPMEYLGMIAILAAVYLVTSSKLQTQSSHPKVLNTSSETASDAEPEPQA